MCNLHGNIETKKQVFSIFSNIYNFVVCFEDIFLSVSISNQCSGNVFCKHARTKYVLSQYIIVTLFSIFVA